MKVQDILTDKSKWCQGAYEKEDGRMCLVGAMVKSYPDHADFDEIYNKILWHTNSGAVSGWNDKSGRTFKQVRALIEELDI